MQYFTIKTKRLQNSLTNNVCCRTMYFCHVDDFVNPQRELVTFGGIDPQVENHWFRRHVTTGFLLKMSSYFSK